MPQSNVPPTYTTLTLFGLKPNRIRWGLAQMGTSPPLLKSVPGLSFFKLLGSGKGQVFSLKPDFKRYGLFATWQSEDAANDFFTKSEIMQLYQDNSQEIWTIKLLPYKAHGLWDGKNPLPNLAVEPAPLQSVAVLTRAAINWRSLPAFWKNGTLTSQALESAPGVMAAIGLGELPFVRQATFSIWSSQAHMQNYAYQNQAHRKVVHRTRSEKWYKEELFARFQVLSAEGTWNGINPLVTGLAGI
ncbi:spheroidene monooxygenase [Adhaeribacter radiodurans]|uniref:Spheroidene monooxygenase n=1 Tax=Adhaeribacter radiodurans TaxID=2745197 RepID=A0A7L7L7G8_9BACT|nr:spheroidene monooxygenase [Adhaeribacter radiodurans]QMU28309.1 spheroidene monooxygenase [Adhaeribacter radiodurans]